MTPLLLLMALAAPVTARPAKIPKNAPWCAAADAPQLFLSPMGEPFRAKGGEPYPSATWFRRADADHDGRLSADEFVADAAAFFRRLDTDRDAALGPDEIALYERDLPEISLYRPSAERGERRKGRDRDQSYGGAMGAGRYSFLNVPQPIWSADADLDRAVTAAEFTAAARKRFALLDKGARGWLALADLPPTPAQAERVGPCQPRPAPDKPRP